MPPAVVTIFGGTGFVGRYLVQRLAERGVRMRIATRRPSRANFLRPMASVGQIAPIRIDIGDDTSVAAALAGSDAAVNLVGILHERGRSTFRAVHVEAAARIARCAAAAGLARLVHVSAIGADAQSPSAYGRSKAEGEAAVSAAFPDVAVVRPSIVFGPEDDFFNRFAAMARFLPALPLIGGGGTRFQPVHVADLAEAIARILETPLTAGRTYEIGGPTVYSFRELMVLLLEEIGRRRMLIPVPWPLARMKAAVLEILPSPPLTRDQVEMLRRDNVVSGDARGLADLGIAPTAAEIILPTYLARFRRDGGRAGRSA